MNTNIRCYVFNRILRALNNFFLSSLCNAVVIADKAQMANEDTAGYVHNYLVVDLQANCERR